MIYQSNSLEAVSKQDSEQAHQACQAYAEASLAFEKHPRQKNSPAAKIIVKRYPAVEWLDKPDKQVIVLMLDKIAEL